ncbi:hypothetical protein LSCM1_01379 [Leishmania martiniquensis]|uniref:Uncharacterized protein n=1 Tax=Leishmania martiniquensis TaxID=1580590 RepID=A0A836GP24_9TRYP|nr:hypothetical protein LSCM1_01379 [Leishmania martiniquensis]
MANPLEVVAAAEERGTARATEYGGETHANASAVGKGGILKSSMREVLDRVIIHEDRPIENLPPMAAPELMLIGCCVSLCARQRVEGVTKMFHYTGLVASVSLAAVTLRHVIRYSHADYKSYLSREDNIGRMGHGLRAAVGHRSDCEFERESHDCNAGREIRVGDNHELADMSDMTISGPVDAAGSLAPAVGLVTEDELDSIASGWRQEAHEPTSETSAAAAHREGSRSSPRAVRHRRFRTFDGSFGPIPYVTFLRKSIHEVEFGRDPRSSFYSLFQDPAKHIGDMQHLRMFVRRYLVHTSEGNNPRQVPLYAYLSARCAWPSVDRELVSRLVHEELVGLLKTDRAIEEEKKRTRHRGAPGGAPVNHQSSELLLSRRAIRHLRNAVQLSCFVGVGVLLLIAAFVIHLGVVLSVLGDPLIVQYSVKLLGYYILAVLVWLAAGLCTILHNLSSRSSLRPPVETLMISSIWFTGAVACTIMVVVVTVEHLQNSNIYAFMSGTAESDICSFYLKYECSGLFEGCASRTGPMCKSLCAVMFPYKRCFEFVWRRLGLVVAPLLTLSILIGLVVLYSFFSLWRQFRLAESMSGRMPELGSSAR